MNEEQLIKEINSRYKKLPENPELIKESFKLFPSQEKIKNDCIKNIEKGIFNFFSICGVYGSGKTFIAKHIGKEIEKNKYITFHYGLWQTDLELMHKHFLTELAYVVGKKKERKIELSITNSKLLDKASSCIFFVIGLILTFTIFNLISQSSSFIKPMFLYVCDLFICIMKLPIQLCISYYPIYHIFECVLINLNYNFIFTIMSALLSITSSVLITHFIYIRTGGSLYGITSILGFGFGETSGSISTHNFYDIFNEIIKGKNIFIIIDNLDRVSKNDIQDTLAFLDNVKSMIEKYNQGESTNRVFVCIPIYKKKVVEVLEYSLRVK